MLGVAIGVFSPGVFSLGLWAGLGWAGNIHNYFSQLLTIYDKAQCWYALSPTDHPFCQNPLKRWLLVPVSAWSVQCNGYPD